MEGVRSVQVKSHGSHQPVSSEALLAEILKIVTVAFLVFGWVFNSNRLIFWALGSGAILVLLAISRGGSLPPSGLSYPIIKRSASAPDLIHKT